MSAIFDDPAAALEKIRQLKADLADRDYLIAQLWERSNAAGDPHLLEVYQQATGQGGQP